MPAAPTTIARRPPLRLTSSQMTSAASGLAAIIVTVNQHWGQIVGIPGVHVPAWLTLIIQVSGTLIPMFSRSLSGTNSGTGIGVVASTGVAAAPPVSPSPVSPLTPGGDSQ